MSDYDFRPGGSLKLKGGVAEGGVVKKKKKSSKSQARHDKERELERQREARLKEDEEEAKSGSPSTSSRNSPAVGGSNDRKTDAERRFEETQKRRLAEKVARLANKSHKDRVSDFNAKLEALSEHHDIPKVGPG
ncbi:hypothetical protein JAAARDRAFT_168940 [Jaapia argillacea MUCL 33604]|uniref:DUF1754-domain-containing protein n=1 Tax=Jaapia argillacea MUCL 33604 TaxID=933084 RepID=A0A067QKY3_9AGAM|nr:hypothetical protein JAAARDRAFT_168940 [Jaapia argillacea MUCL 33604]